MHEFLSSIKQAAVEAVEAAKPVQVVYGTVQSVSPLKISREQKQTLSREFLVTMGQTFTVGDKVVLLRIQGGQEYLVLGKKGNS